MSVSEFQTDLAKRLLGDLEDDCKISEVVRKVSKLVKKHDKQLEEADFSVPLNESIWKHCLGSENSKIALHIDKLLDENGKSNSYGGLDIRSVKPAGKVYRIQVSRKDVFKKCIKQTLNPGFCATKRNLLVRVNNKELLRTGKSSISSQLRCNLVQRVIKNALSQCGYLLGEDDLSDVKINIGCKDAKYLVEGDGARNAEIPVQVGVVVAASKKCEEHLMENLYDPIFRKYQSIALGRENQDIAAAEQLRNIHSATSADIGLQLLSTTISHSCSISPSSNLSSTILYNYARVVHIFRAFEDPHSEYPDLPALDETDFSLLKEPEEWELLFNYVLPYKELLSSIVQDLLHNEGCRLPKLVQHLSGMAMAFSKYYNRVHVLKDPRPQLLPTMFARIRLLQALKLTFTDAFHILGIEPLNNM